MQNESMNTPKSNLKHFIIQLKRSFVLTKKDLKVYYNKPPVLIQGIIFPIILFVAFTIGRIIPPNYLISGLMAMVLFLTTTSIGPIIFPWETMRKTLERVITCPVTIGTILLGNIWSGFIYGVTFSSIPLVLGIVFFSAYSSLNLFLIIWGLIAAAFSFGCLSLILSIPPSQSPGDTMVMTILIKFPLLFISPLFMSISSNPLAIISPLTYFIDIVNVGLGETSAFGAFGTLFDFLMLILFSIVSILIAFTLHQKTLQKRFTG